MAKSTGRFVFQHSAKHSLIKIEDVADFEIRGGRQIRVWPAAGTTEKDIEIFLFGPAWATLCHQREMLPLHASAIVTKGGIAAFAGNSGAGKSTNAASLNSLGYELLADDILPVSFNQNSIPGAWPYLRRMKLFREPIIQLGFRPAEMVSETLDKKRYFVLPKSAGDDKWRRLERIYVLENKVTGSHALIEQITGADAVRTLVDQTYHLDFILGTRRFGEHLAFCTRLASTVPIYRLRRPPYVTREKGLALSSARTLKARTLSSTLAAWAWSTRILPVCPSPGRALSANFRARRWELRIDADQRPLTVTTNRK